MQNVFFSLSLKQLQSVGWSRNFFDYIVQFDRSFRVILTKRRLELTWTAYLSSRSRFPVGILLCHKTTCVFARVCATRLAVCYDHQFRFSHLTMSTGILLILQNNYDDFSCAYYYYYYYYECAFEGPLSVSKSNCFCCHVPPTAVLCSRGRSLCDVLVLASNLFVR